MSKVSRTRCRHGLEPGKELIKLLHELEQAKASLSLGSLLPAQAGLAEMSFGTDHPPQGQTPMCSRPLSSKSRTPLTPDPATGLGDF